MASVREDVVVIYGDPIASINQMKLDLSGDVLTESQKKTVLAYLTGLTAQNTSWD